MLACAAGFFATIDQPGKTLRAEIIGTVVAFLVALPLLPLLGAVGLAIGTLAATLASSWALAHDLGAYGVRVGPTLWLSITMSGAAGALGWLVAEALGPTLWGALAAGVAGMAAYALFVWLFQRDTARDTIALARRVFPRRVAPA